VSRKVDDIVLDPVEMSPGRTELNLSKAGLSVIGADFGEAAIEGNLVRQQFGEALVDRRPKAKTVTLRLAVREDAEADLATAAYRLQQKVGTLHREGGWMRRDFHVGEFAGSLLCKIVGEVTLGEFAGWQAGASPDVTLTLVCGPIWYSTEVDESPLFVEESARALVYELPETKGTAEGLKRIAVTNKNTTGDWRGLIWAEECRDYREGDTAYPIFEADALTLKGGASSVFFSGATGTKVVQHSALTAGWLTILESQIQGVGHMTHLGTRRVKMRVHSPNPAGSVELRLLWRALGSSSWSEDNPVVATPLANGFAIVDLGECRPQQAALGEQRWEWKLMARAPSGSGTIRIDQVYVLPAEQYAEIRTPERPQTADFLEAELPGTAANDAVSGGTAWTIPAGALVSDDTYATVTVPANGFLESQFLKATNFGFAIPAGATVTGIVVGVERSASESSGSRWAFDVSAAIVKGGVVQTAVNKANYFQFWPTTDQVKTYGSATDLWGQTWTPADINATGFGFGLRVMLYSTETEGVPAVPVTASVDSVEITVYYTHTVDENRTCFAQRSLWLESEGTFRQHQTEDVWGGLVSDGFLPYAVPSALERRPVRGLILPSQGDLETLPDSGTNKLNARVETRAGYHFAREAL
jgi:hypothetical protein